MLRAEIRVELYTAHSLHALIPVADSRRNTDSRINFEILGLNHRLVRPLRRHVGLYTWRTFPAPPRTAYSHPTQSTAPVHTVYLRQQGSQKPEYWKQRPYDQADVSSAIQETTF